MTPALALHPMGIVLGALYAAIFGGILWWMLHPPPHVQWEGAKARRSTDGLKPVRVLRVGVAYLERGFGLQNGTSSRNGTGKT